MLRKLYKHELYSLYRILLPLYLVLLGLAFLSKIMGLIKTDNAVSLITTRFSSILSVISVICIFIVGFVTVIVRFYQNLLGKQGYLTFSLPFTATEHIVCKVLCGVCVTVTNVLAVFISIFIMAFKTDFGSDFILTLKSGYRELCGELGESTVITVLAEIAVILIISAFASLLMSYASMSVGQQFKNRIFASVIAYFCFYAAWEFIDSVILIVFSLINVIKIDSLQNTSVFSVIQLIFIPVTVLILIQGTVYFFVTRFFLSKHLNLE